MTRIIRKLKELSIAMSGTCPICGDVLFSPPVRAEGQTLENVIKKMENVFESHLIERHPMPVCNGS